jgi:hypothetical protein
MLLRAKAIFHLPVIAGKLYSNGNKGRFGKWIEFEKAFDTRINIIFDEMGVLLKGTGKLYKAICDELACYLVPKLTKNDFYSLRALRTVFDFSSLHDISVRAVLFSISKAEF